MAQPLNDPHFVTSAASVQQLGVAHAEVAFVGRSNVGKSSLLNALCFQKSLAKTSKTPGRTRLINIFATGVDRWIVDLPGYGYASGPATERRTWKPLIDALHTRASLHGLFVIVDARPKINAVGNHGGFLGPYMMGAIKDATGSFSIGLLSISMGVLASGVILAALGHDRRLENVPEGANAALAE